MTLPTSNAPIAIKATFFPVGSCVMYIIDRTFAVNTSNEGWLTACGLTRTPSDKHHKRIVTSHTRVVLSRNIDGLSIDHSVDWAMEAMVILRRQSEYRHTRTIKSDSRVGGGGNIQQLGNGEVAPFHPKLPCQIEGLIYNKSAICCAAYPKGILGILHWSSIRLQFPREEIVETTIFLDVGFQ